MKEAYLACGSCGAELIHKVYINRSTKQANAAWVPEQRRRETSISIRDQDGIGGTMMLRRGLLIIAVLLSASLFMPDCAAKEEPALATDEAEAEVQPKRPPVFVVLVHGTTHINSLLGLVLGDDRWCQDDDSSGFVQAFRASFLEAEPDADLHIQPFQWGGDDSNPDRHNGGIELKNLLDSLPTDSKVYVIAHSHGGNVALRALTFSTRDADTLVLLGTPFLGVYMEIEETGKGYRIPLYLPLPREAPNTHIVNIYSPQDSVATNMANLLPGTTFTDLQYTNAESWRRLWRLDRAKVWAPRNKKPGYRMKKVKAGAVYHMDLGTAVIDQRLDESLQTNVTNVSLPAQTTQTTYGGPVKANWVHTQLHSAQIATALGHALATDSFADFADSVGTLHK